LNPIRSGILGIVGVSCEVHADEAVAVNSLTGAGEVSAVLVADSVEVAFKICFYFVDLLIK